MAQKKNRIHPVLMVTIWSLALVLITIIVVLALGYRYTSDSGIKFVGKVKNGQPWSGWMKYPGGITATLDKEHRTIKFENGDVYVGDIDILCRDGKGVMTWAKGDKYEGEFRRDAIHGKGTFYYSNEDIYDGDFENGSRHGQGTMHWANNDVYEGGFVNNAMEGYGKYTWANGNTYEGNYFKDARHGEGVLIMPNGEKTEKYDGEWVNDKKWGKGVIEYANGDRYSGAFINGLPDTRVTDENGSFMLMEDGRYRHGAAAIYIYADGKEYMGYFEAGKIVVVENDATTPAAPSSDENSTDN